jgi:PilZ domain
MNGLPHHRTSQRFQSEAPVTLEDFRTGFYYNGMLYNYSTDGGYFESKYAPRPGRKIHIKVNDLPNESTPHVHLAEIRWRKPLPENPSSYTYGVGIKYC